MSRNMSILDSILRTLRFKKDDSKKKAKIEQRRLTLEQLEERQMLAVVTLEMTDPIAFEAPTNTSANWGYATIRRDQSESTPLTVSYEVTGSATHGTDYTSLGASLSRIDVTTGLAVYRGSATIPANQTTTTIVVKPINDALREGSETVAISLLESTTYVSGDSGCGGSSCGGSGCGGTGCGGTGCGGTGCGCSGGGETGSELTYYLGSNTSGLITIEDNDNWSVKVDAIDAIGRETNTGETPDPIKYRFTRSGETDLTHSLIVYYRFSGTATRNSDFTLGSGSYNSTYDYGSVTIPSGQSYIDLTLNVVNDSVIEVTETVIVTLLTQSPTSGSSAIPYYTLGTPSTAIAEIEDNDSPAETPLVWMNSVYHGAEGGENGYFELKRSSTSGSLVVYYSFDASNSTATKGVDFQYLPGTSSSSNRGNITFANGSDTAFIPVNIIDDSIQEAIEFVYVSLILNPSNSSAYAIDTLHDRDAVSIYDNDAPSTGTSVWVDSVRDAKEGLNGGYFRFWRDSTASVLTVQYAINTNSSTAKNGVDFTALPGTVYNSTTQTWSAFGNVTFAAGASYVDVPVIVADDNLYEGTELLDIFLTSTGAYLIPPNREKGSISIFDKSPVPEVWIDSAQNASEGDIGGGYFRIQRSNTANALSVAYSIDVLNTTATSGTDYTALSGTVTFGQGEQYADIPVFALGDSIIEGNESLRIILENASGNEYEVNQNRAAATVMILDANVAPMVWVDSVQNGIERSSPQHGYFRLKRDSYADAVTVHYEIDTVVSTTTNGRDHQALPGTVYESANSAWTTSGVVTFSAGVQYVDIPVTVINDTYREGTEILAISLLPFVSDSGAPVGYYLDEQKDTASLEIADDETIQTIWIDSAGNATEGGQDGYFRLKRNSNSGSLTVYYLLDHQNSSALNGTDHTLLPGTSATNHYGSVTFLSGSYTADIPVAVFDDSIRENAENVIITLVQSTSPTYSPSWNTNLPYAFATDKPKSAEIFVVDNDGEMEISAGGSYKVDVAGEVTLIAQKRHDPYGAADWTWLWDFTGDGNYNDASGQIVTFHAGNATVDTVKTVRVKAVDSLGNIAYSSAEVTVAASATDAQPALVVKTNFAGTSLPHNGNGLSYGSKAFGGGIIQDLKFFNTGDAPLSFVLDTMNLPEGVTLIDYVPGVIEPGDVFEFRFAWDALVALSGAITIITNDPDNSEFILNLSGSITSGSLAPSVQNLHLYYDTGESTEDDITANPILVGKVNGTSNAAITMVEFDHNNDGIAEGRVEVDAYDKSFVYDPRSFDLNWPQPTSSNSNVSVKYRVVTVSPHDQAISYSTSWSSAFGYTVAPAPISTATPGSMEIVSGTIDESTGNLNLAIKGTVSGSNAHAVEVMINGQPASRSVGVLQGSQFYVPISGSIPFAQSATIRVRAVEYDTDLKMEIYGNWTNYTFTRAKATVSTFTLLNDTGSSSSDGVTSDLTLQGTLSNVLDASYAEVEFLIGSQVIGSTRADVNGYFSFTPSELPLNNGNREATIIARTVHRNGTTATYGTSKQKWVRYTPEAIPGLAMIQLAKPKTGTSTTTSDPVIVVKNTVEIGSEANYEFSWKTSSSSTWSDPVFVPFEIPEDENSSTQSSICITQGEFRIPGLYLINNATQTINVRARAISWDPILEQNKSSEWVTLTFTYEKPLFEVVPIELLELAEMPGASSNVTVADPTIVGQLGGDNLQGHTIEVYEGSTLLSTVKSDSEGAFTFTPQGLGAGVHTLKVRLMEWNPVSESYAYGDFVEITFTLSETSTPPPQIRTLLLADHDGNNTTSNPVVTGSLLEDGTVLNRTLIEFDTAGNGTVTDSVYTNIYGQFTWLPTLSSGQHVIKARACRYNASSGSWVAGEWAHLPVTVVTAPSNAPSISVLTLPFGQALGNGIVSDNPTVFGQVSSSEGFEHITVGIDIDGNGAYEYTTTVDELGQFQYRLDGLDYGSAYEIKVRAIYGNEEMSLTSPWKSTAFVYRDLDGQNMESILTNLEILKGDESEERVITGNIALKQGVTLALVELDYTGDDSPDGFVAPDSNGRFEYSTLIGKSEIRARILEIYSDGTTAYGSNGWMSFQTNINTTLKSVRVKEPVISSKEEQQSVLELSLDSATVATETRSETVASREYEIALNSIITSSASQPQGTSGVHDTTVPNGLTQADYDRIANANLPPLPDLNLFGAIPALEKDQKLKDELDAVHKTFNKSVSDADEVFQKSFDKAVAKFNEDNEKAWNTYSSEYEPLNKEYERVLLSTFEASGEYRQLTREHEANNLRINQKHQADVSALDTRYQEEGNGYLAERNAALAALPHNGCGNSNHTDACEDASRYIGYEYSDKIDAMYFRKEKEMVSLRAEKEKSLLDERKDYHTKVSNGKANFEREKVLDLTRVLDKLAEIACDYEKAVASAKKPMLESYADGIEISQKAKITAWKNAVVDIYTKQENAIKRWKDAEGTDSDWAAFVFDQFTHAKTEGIADATAAHTYETQAIAKEAFMLKKVSGEQCTTSHELSELTKETQKSYNDKNKELKFADIKAANAFEVSCINDYNTKAKEQVDAWKSARHADSVAEEAYNIAINQDGCNSVMRRLNESLVALRRQYDRGQISETNYRAQIATLTHQAYTDVGALGQINDTIFSAREESYRVATSARMEALAKKQAEFYHVLEYAKADALNKFWTDSIDLGMERNAKLTTKFDAFNSAAHSAQSDFENQVNTFEETYLTALRESRDTRSEADTTSEDEYVSEGVDDYFSQVDELVESVDWSTADQTWFASLVLLLADTLSGELASVTTIIDTILEKSMDQWDDYIDNYNSLFGTLDTFLATYTDDVSDDNNLNVKNLFQNDAALTREQVTADTNSLKEIADAEKTAREDHATEAKKLSRRRAEYAAEALRDYISRYPNGFIPNGSSCGQYYTSCNRGYDQFSAALLPFDLDILCSDCGPVVNYGLGDGTLASFRDSGCYGSLYFGLETSFLKDAVGVEGTPYYDSSYFAWVYFGTASGVHTDTFNALWNNSSLQHDKIDAKLNSEKKRIEAEWTEESLRIFKKHEGDVNTKVQDGIKAEGEKWITFDGDVESSILDTIEENWLDTITHSTIDDFLNYFKDDSNAQIDLRAGLWDTLGQYQIDWRNEVIQEENLAYPHSISGQSQLYIQDETADLEEFVGEQSFAGPQSYCPGQNPFVDDLDQIINIVQSRDIYFDFITGEIHSYNEQATTALSAYADAMVEASRQLSKDLGEADASLINAQDTAESKFNTDWFALVKGRNEAYVDAAIKEMVDAVEHEYELALAEEAAIANAADEAESTIKHELDDRPRNPLLPTLPEPGDPIAPITPPTSSPWYIALQDQLDSVATIIALETQAKASRKTVTESSREQHKADSKSEKEASESLADKEFGKQGDKVSETYYQSLVDSNDEYVDAYSISWETYHESVVDSEIDARTSLNLNENALTEEYCRLTGLYIDAVNSGALVDAIYYENGTSTTYANVCFVEGTKFRLDNGEEKTVENFKSGDKFSTPDQNDPEGRHILSEVVEVYHNAPQPVYRLVIAKTDSDEGMELRTTKEHPFYVVGKGWTSVSDLELNDVFLSKSGSKNLVLKEKELEPEPVPVYNIQVKGTHTYFVGESDDMSVLAHNACSKQELETYLKHTESLYVTLQNLRQQDGVSEEVLRKQYKEYLDAREKASEMYSEYIASIWIKSTASKLNECEKKLPTRLLELDHLLDPGYISEYSRSMQESTQEATEVLEKYDELVGKVELGMKVTSATCIIVGGGGLGIVAGALGAPVVLTGFVSGASLGLGGYLGVSAYNGTDVTYADMAFYTGAGGAAGAIGAGAWSLTGMGLQAYAGASSVNCLGYGSWFLMGGVSAAAGDATYQGLGLVTGYQEEYSWTQTASSFALGGVFGMATRWLTVPKGSGCFTEGTQVVVGLGVAEDGTILYDTKNIEDITVGDLVYNYDTVTGEYGYSEVTNTTALTSDHVRYLTIIDEHGNEQTLETTDAHPFWVVTDEPDLTRAARELVDENGVWLYHEDVAPEGDGYWVEAKDLRVGDVFLGANGELSTLQSTLKVDQTGGVSVFNFEVAGNHDYFVLAKEYEYGQTCVLVHNTVKCWKPGDPIDQKTSKGKDPAWSTVQKRFWKNEALLNKNNNTYSAENLKRMKNGRAPRVRARVEQANGKPKDVVASLELHHAEIFQREPALGVHAQTNLVKCTPWVHAVLDKYRHVGTTMIKIIDGVDTFVK